MFKSRRLVILCSLLCFIVTVWYGLTIMPRYFQYALDETRIRDIGHALSNSGAGGNSERIDQILTKYI